MQNEKKKLNVKLQVKMLSCEKKLMSKFKTNMCPLLGMQLGHHTILFNHSVHHFYLLSTSFQLPITGVFCKNT